MKPMQRILVPVDFSEGSELAVDFAFGLADKLGASQAHPAEHQGP